MIMQLRTRLHNPGNPVQVSSASYRTLLNLDSRPITNAMDRYPGCSIIYFQSLSFEVLNAESLERMHSALSIASKHHRYFRKIFPVPPSSSYCKTFLYDACDSQMWTTINISDTYIT